MRVVLISADYRLSNVRLQPWRFLSEIVNGLSEIGHRTTIVSDAGPEQAPKGTKLVGSVRLPAFGNSELERQIDDLKPDICLWNFGLSSTWHFSPTRLRWPSIALFTSPIYSMGELLGLGFRRLWLARNYAPIHLIGSTIPAAQLRTTLSAFQAVIVQSEATLQSLRARGVREDRTYLVTPGLDEEFRTPLPAPTTLDEPFRLSYMGSPLPVRGTFDLVDAIGLARRSGLNVRLTVLSRNQGELNSHERRLSNHIGRRGLHDAIRIRSGFMRRERLIAELSEAHMIALPFQIVPSDAPLAVLEGMALGRPILSTRVGSVTEYLTDGRGYLADPGDPRLIAKAILRAAQGPVERERVRERALSHARSFNSWQQVALQVADIIGAPPCVSS